MGSETRRVVAAAHVTTLADDMAAPQKSKRLLERRQIGDERLTLVGVVHTGIGHRVAWHGGLRIRDVFVEFFGRPLQIRALHRAAVCKARHAGALATYD